MLSRCCEDAMLVKMVCFVLNAQSVLIYDVNKPVDRILSCRAWFPVYLIVFYKRQYLRNLSLYKYIYIYINIYIECKGTVLVLYWDMMGIKQHT